MKWGSYNAESQGPSTDSDSVSLGLQSQDLALSTRIKLFGCLWYKWSRATLEGTLEKNKRKQGLRTEGHTVRDGV